MWFALLWAVGYPADERLGVVIIAYVALWLAKEVVGALTLFLLKSAHRYGLRAAERAGIDISGGADAAAGESPAPARINFVGAFLLLAVVATILGCALAPVTYIASAFGLAALDAYFAAAGFAMLGAGVSVLALFFLLSYALFSSMHKATNLMSRMRQISRIQESETLLRRRLGAQPGLS